MDGIADLLRTCVEELDDDGEPPVAGVTAVLSRNSESPLPLYDLATRCRCQGRMDLWRGLVGAALTMPHHSYQEIYRRGQAKLLLGDWSGWTDLESRIHDPAGGYLASRTVRLLRFNTRGWDGRENIEDKTLYVVADGGFGDCLQMLRYTSTLSARARRVILCLRPELVSLVRRAYGDRIALTLHGVEDPTSYDRYAWMMSLPALMGGFPPFVPLPGVTRDEDPTNDIGICWSGDPNGSNGERSVSLDLLASLFQRRDIRWHSLQTGAAASEIRPEWRMQPMPTPTHSFAQMAQLIAKMGAVITVDTAVAHLAGVMGVPTWVLLAADADPRWGLGTTTPWYPTVRLIRQRAIGNWTDVQAALSAEFEAHPWRVETV